MAQYTAIIFDLFDTVVNFDEQKMPDVIIDGEVVRTTSEEIYRVFSAHYPELDDYAAFHRTWMEVSKEVWAEREAHQVEHSSHERFQRFVERLSIAANDILPGVIERAVERHMTLLVDSTDFPESNRALLEQLRQRYRIALLSNFDHSPAVERLLQKYQLEEMFEAVVVSVDHRIRKPRRELFDIMLQRLGLGASEALFVGDTFNADVVGAKNAGMDVVWINAKGREPTDPSIKPDYTIYSLPELATIL